jgi:hypothetical protein
MNYWGDRRDQLETLYPACTSFCHYHAKLPPHLVEQTKLGVIFLHAFWSGPSVVKFKYACYALEDSVPWESFEFHVVDVDGLLPGSIFDGTNNSAGMAKHSGSRMAALSHHRDAIGVMNNSMNIPQIFSKA